MAVVGSGRPIPVLSPMRLAVGEVGRSVAGRSFGADLGLRVLLVDDSHVTREMIRRLLEDGGFSVAVAGGADEALGVLSERDFECLVTDIEMPGMDGLELTRHLRGIGQFEHLPIIVVSTRDRAEDRLAGLEAGADAYLTKQGLNARELVALVRRVGGRP
jgi:CheY-like chemotaxis protein